MSMTGLFILLAIIFLSFFISYVAYAYKNSSDKANFFNPKSWFTRSQHEVPHMKAVPGELSFPAFVFGEPDIVPGREVLIEPYHPGTFPIFSSSITGII